MIEFIEGLIGSFINQGKFGVIICLLILGVFIGAVVTTLKVKKVYDDAIKNFENSEEQEGDGILEKNFKDEILINIVNKFKKSAQRGTEDINTEVIIQREFSNKVKWEKQIKGVSATLIALGLLGTFLGLVFAIGGLQESFGEIQSMDTFKESMSGPLSSMGGAFWTSILGVFTSVILNIILINMNKSKETFYDLIEDYLDNNIYAKYAKTFNASFDNMVKTLGVNMERFNSEVEGSMKKLACDMSKLFNDGVNKLVEKINKNTIDLTESMKGLQNYTKDLERLTGSLEKSVNNFKEPVDNFKNSIEDFTSISEDLTKVMESSVHIFATRVEKLDENLTTLYKSTDENKEEISKIGEYLKAETENLKTTYDSLVKSVECVVKNNTNSTAELSEEVGNLNSGYKLFSESLGGFIDNLKTLQVNISNGISDTLKSEMSTLTKGIVSELGNSMNDVTEATKQLTRNSIDIGELIKQTNDFYVTTIREKTEVVADEI